MTQSEKIAQLRPAISRLYEKEGRSVSYIARLFDVDRSNLSKRVRAWGMVQANVSYLTPSNRKFANRHRQKILSMFRNDVSESEIARTLDVGRDYLRNIVEKTPELRQARQEYIDRVHAHAEQMRADAMASSRLNYYKDDLPGEEWKPVLGHEGYDVSNMGRVRSYARRNRCYYLLTPSPNMRNGRLYVTLDGKNLNLARLVAFAFVPGHSAERDTVDHKDGDVTNNRASNLRWTSQSENNAAAYANGRRPNRAYQANGRFKEVVVDGKYRFKTIEAMARFYGVSSTQAQRYISGETKFSHKISLVY